MSTDLTEYDPFDNPADYGWPPLLALEIATGTNTTQEICEALDISRERWNEIRVNPIFIAELKNAVELVKSEGMGYKLRAKMQSLHLLNKSWEMINEDNPERVPASVRADLIKFTARVAGFDPQYNGEAKGNQGSGGPSVAIQINLDRSDK
jgi:hypothetical protein